jgi:hypothetical protein
MGKSTDGFDYDDPDETEAGSRRVIQGSKFVFTNESVWIDQDENEVPADRELIIAERVRLLQKWGKNGGPPLESRFLDPGEKKPDIEKLNDATPRSEWRTGFNGKPEGPWQLSWVVYLFDPKNGAKATYITSTTGGNMAIGALSEQVKNIRKLYGDDKIYPVVTLSDTFMPTQWGGRQRPDFKVLRFVRFGNGNEALSAPEKRALPPAKEAKKPAPETTGNTGIEVIEKPTLKEEVDDEIPF